MKSNKYASERSTAFRMWSIIPCLQNSFMKRIYSFDIVYALFCCWLFLSGCYNGKIATSQSVKAYVSYPQIVAELHAKWYPVKVTRDSFTQYLPGKTIYTPGEVQYVDCDSATKANNGKPPSAVSVPCPPGEKRVDTVYKNVYYQVENTAALEAERLKNQDANEVFFHLAVQKGQLKKAANMWRNAAITSWVLIALVLAFKFLRRKWLS